MSALEVVIEYRCPYYRNGIQNSKVACRTTNKCSLTSNSKLKTNEIQNVYFMWNSNNFRLWFVVWSGWGACLLLTRQNYEPSVPSQGNKSVKRKICLKFLMKEHPPHSISDSAINSRQRFQTDEHILRMLAFESAPSWTLPTPLPRITEGSPPSTITSSLSYSSTPSKVHLPQI